MAERKAHVKRIKSHADDSVWVDLLRIDKLPLSMRGAQDGVTGQIVNYVMDWNDDPNNPGQDADRKYDDITIDQTNGETFNPSGGGSPSGGGVDLQIIKSTKFSFKGEKDGTTNQVTKFVFDNDPSHHTSRKFATVRVVNNDLGGFDPGDQIVKWDDYQNYLNQGVIDDSQSIDVEMIDKFKVSWEGKADGTRGQVIAYALTGNKEVEQLFSPSDDGGSAVPVRLDPLEVIVNVSWIKQMTAFFSTSGDGTGYLDQSAGAPNYVSRFKVHCPRVFFLSDDGGHGGDFIFLELDKLGIMVGTEGDPARSGVNDAIDFWGTHNVGNSDGSTNFPQTVPGATVVTWSYPAVPPPPPPPPPPGSNDQLYFSIKGERLDHHPAHDPAPTKLGTQVYSDGDGSVHITDRDIRKYSNHDPPTLLWTNTHTGGPTAHTVDRNAGTITLASSGYIDDGVHYVAKWITVDGASGAIVGTVTYDYGSIMGLTSCVGTDVPRNGANVGDNDKDGNFYFWDATKLYKVDSTGTVTATYAFGLNGGDDAAHTNFAGSGFHTFRPYMAWGKHIFIRDFNQVYGAASQFGGVGGSLLDDFLLILKQEDLSVVSREKIATSRVPTYDEQNPGGFNDPAAAYNIRYLDAIAIFTKPEPYPPSDNFRYKWPPIP